MALKGQQTKSEFVEWYKLETLISKLENKGDAKFALYIAISIYSGLRISDVLSLRWSDVITEDGIKDSIEVIEQKTKKFRTIRINKNLAEIILRMAKNINPDMNELIFLNRFRTSAISTQYVNRKLHDLAIEHKLTKQPKEFKSHSLRKSFGRRVYETNNNSENSLILLSEMFNHTSLKTTRIYLGLRASEIADVYINL